jgi:hypothetical protein
LRRFETFTGFSTAFADKTHAAAAKNPLPQHARGCGVAARRKLKK